MGLIKMDMIANIKFPVLWKGSRERILAHTKLNCPKEIPWSIIELHEKQVLKNHGGQSLTRLNELGGLTPEELYIVLTDRDFRDIFQISFSDAVLYLRSVNEIVDYSLGSVNPRTFSEDLMRAFGEDYRKG